MVGDAIVRGHRSSIGHPNNGSGSDEHEHATAKHDQIPSQGIGRRQRKPDACHQREIAGKANKTLRRKQENRAGNNPAGSPQVRPEYARGSGIAAATIMNVDIHVCMIASDMFYLVRGNPESSTTGRISTVPLLAAGIRPAIAIASSRLAASTKK